MVDDRDAFGTLACTGRRNPVVIPRPESQDATDNRSHMSVSKQTHVHTVGSKHILLLTITRCNSSENKNSSNNTHST